MVAPFGDRPRVVVQSVDGTRIALFSAGTGSAGTGSAGTGLAGAGQGSPVLLVHGTGSDHSTWRAVAPLLASVRPVHAMDRRGRGASGDRPPYAATREVEDLAVAADALAAQHGAPIAVVGHSLGGRLALAATLRTGAIARVIAYEGAPMPVDAVRDGDEERLLAALRSELAADDNDAVLERFMLDAAGLTLDQLAAFRASDLWALRAATAPEIVRELDAALHDPVIGRDALAAVKVPVLLLAGTRSPARFRDGVLALDRRLANGRVAILDGAGHNAHHTHAGAFAKAVSAYVDG